MGRRCCDECDHIVEHGYPRLWCRYLPGHYDPIQSSERFTNDCWLARLAWNYGPRGSPLFSNSRRGSSEYYRTVRYTHNTCKPCNRYTVWFAWCGINYRSWNPPWRWHPLRRRTSVQFTGNRYYWLYWWWIMWRSYSRQYAKPQYEHILWYCQLCRWARIHSRRVAGIESQYGRHSCNRYKRSSRHQFSGAYACKYTVHDARHRLWRTYTEYRSNMAKPASRWSENLWRLPCAFRYAAHTVQTDFCRDDKLYHPTPGRRYSTFVNRKIRQHRKYTFRARLWHANWIYPGYQTNFWSALHRLSWRQFTSIWFSIRYHWRRK